MLTRKTWSVQVDGTSYEVEFVPNVLFANLQLAVNGDPVKIVRHITQGFAGIDQPFEIAGKPCHFVLWNGKVDLAVDGVFLDSKKPYLKHKGFPWWLWILLAVLFVLMVVSGTGFVPLFILLLSGLYLMRLATAPSLPAQKQLLACLGLTAAAGLLTVGLIYMASAAKIDSVFFFGRGTILQSAFADISMQAITSKDGSVSLTAPARWKVVEAGDTPSVLLTVGDRAADIFAMVAWESKTDLAEPLTLQDYAAAIQSVVKESYSDAVWTTVQPSKLGSQPVLLAELDATVNNLKLHYFYTFLETEKGYYRLIGFAKQSKAAAYRTEIFQVTDSFRELKSPAD